MPATLRRKATLVRLVVQTKLGVGMRRAEVLARLHAMTRALNLSDVELSVLLTDDDQIRELNKLYRKKDKSTDVLAFAMGAPSFADTPISPAGQPALLGDVIVSLPTARAQARRAGREPLAEVTMLLAHGLLHLLGWDHDTPAKDRAMRAETERLCSAAKTSRSASKRRRPTRN